MKNKNNKKKNQKEIIDLIIKIVLVAVILILFLHNCSLMEKNNNNKPVNSGNINIIEIKCDNKNTCEPTKPNDDKPNGGNKPGKSTPTPTPPNGGGLVVEDSEIEWNGETEAKIFTNSMYEFNNIIAPESSNTYQFVVKNGTDYKLKYNVSFVENNPYNVNMKYKLKMNDTYIIDHYVSASEVAATNIISELNDNDTFYLEWKWVSSSNDTEIGRINNANYGLKIIVEAESING